MKLIVVGPGRAGGSIALAAARAGHEITGVLSRSPSAVYGPVLELGEQLPPADLLIIAVRDEMIEKVAADLAATSGQVPVAAHLSGFTPVTALHDLAAAGVAIGGFHPLQTLPDAERGSVALAGSFVGIGGDRRARPVLDELARSLGMRPFELSDASRSGYHAGAAAASNFVITALLTAADLMLAAGIEPSVTKPLVERAVANVYAPATESPLTGPIARGDTATVVGQLDAARRVSEDLADQYRLMAEATAIRAGRREDARKWS